MKLTDIVFSCRKCGHLLFVSQDKLSIKSLTMIAKKDCPECGEEGYENWILTRSENYQKEFFSK
jgi:DNA replicative helicase MCM subunit Mcm2 (Cdc46/Mcm family)